MSQIARLLETLRRFLSSQETRRTFVLYVCIGVVGVAFYVVVLRLLLTFSVKYYFAFTIAFCLGVTAQFIMNRCLNFRASDRAIHFQAASYAFVTAATYAVMMLIGWFGVSILRVNPIAAYLMSVPVNLPVGYLANRYLTFAVVRPRNKANALRDQMLE